MHVYRSDGLYHHRPAKARASDFHSSGAAGGSVRSRDAGPVAREIGFQVQQHLKETRYCWPKTAVSLRSSATRKTAAATSRRRARKRLQDGREAAGAPSDTPFACELADAFS